MVVEKKSYPERRYIQSVYAQTQRRELHITDGKCLNCESEESCGFHPGLCCACVAAALPKAPHKGAPGTPAEPQRNANITAWS